jgi:putative ABC transport system permease protein
MRRRKSMLTDLDQDIRDHIERETQDNIDRGMPPEEARYAALRKFGNVTRVQEETREVWSFGWLEQLGQDVRYGLRQLRRNPGFAAVGVLTLALGIGANTAIFSLFDAMVLRLLPVQRPDELVLLEKLDPLTRDEDSFFTNPSWEQLRDQQDVFSGVVAWGAVPEEFDLAQGGAVQHANGLYTSGSYFATLGVRPSVGRLFNAADDRHGCAALAVLSYGFWQDHFGGEQSAVGKVLSLNHHPFQIIGVSAPGFYGTEVGYKFEVAVPVCAAPVLNVYRQLDERSGRWLRIIGRVKPGLSREQLRARLAVLSPQVTGLKQVLVSAPAANGISDLRVQFGKPLHILMAVVGMVLLIACANVASLLLARSAGRRKEIAVRRALGASRVRLIRQLLTECILLSATGALVGVLFARWGAALLVRYLTTAQHPVFLHLSLDSRVLGFTAASAALTGILFGVLPAFWSTRVSLAAAMKGSDRVGTERHGQLRTGQWIVSSQVALSLILLLAAGLLLRSFEKLATLDIGFDRNNVLLVNVNLKGTHVPLGQRLQTYQEIGDRLRVLPGVISASRSMITPIGGEGYAYGVRPDSSVALKGPADTGFTVFNFVSSGYLETLRIPLLAGRSFNDLDTKTGPPVAIVNQTLARRFYPNVNPVGRYFRVAESPRKLGPPVRIVGLMQDSNYDSLREEPYATVFAPITQIAPYTVIDEVEIFELRTAIPPSALAHSVECAVAGVNESISIELHTLTQQVSDAMVQERLLALLSAFFGVLALLLAMVGLYGTFSYLVTQRRVEFGIRMALGAQRGSILRLVMLDLIAVLAGGLVVGICVSLAATRVLQQMLFGLGPRDPLTMIAAGGILSAVALFAGYFPARRATKVDPMVALRYE